jgi:hypothetical protein
MRDTLQNVVSLQREYNAWSTSAMKKRGILIRSTLPDEMRRVLRAALGACGNDTDAQGRDNTGKYSRIPWVRWFSRSLSPSATRGWYVVYLFHPDASGVSLCLIHGSTNQEGNALVEKSAAEVAEVMNWASTLVGNEFDQDATVQRGILLGTFGLARAYERTTLFSKFYTTGAIPSDAILEADLIRFVSVLAKLYRASYQPRTVPGTR